MQDPLDVMIQQINWELWSDRPKDEYIAEGLERRWVGAGQRRVGLVVLR